MLRLHLNPFVAIGWLILAGCSNRAPARSPAPQPAAEQPSPARLVSPHSQSMQPEVTRGSATQDERWWEAETPCPENASVEGGAPPEQFRIGCKTNNGKNHGRRTEFHPNGKKSGEGYFENHFAEGVWTEWDALGNKIKEVEYVRGQRQGTETEWAPDGKLVAQRRYKSGKRDGLTQIWDEAGNLRTVIKYENGKEEGIATYWDRSGRVHKLIEYEAGVARRVQQ